VKKMVGPKTKFFPSPGITRMKHAYWQRTIDRSAVDLQRLRDGRWSHTVRFRLLDLGGINCGLRPLYTPRALVSFSASFIVADAVCDLEDLFP
jgi:hypothetical protein